MTRNPPAPAKHSRRGLRRVVLSVAGMMLALGGLVLAMRLRAEWNNRSVFAVSVGSGGAFVPAAAQASEETRRAAPFVVNDAKHSDIVWVTASGELRLFRVTLPESRSVVVTAVLTLDADRTAFAAIRQRKDGRYDGHFGITDARIGMAHTREVGRVDALARDAGGRLVAFVPCDAPRIVRDLQEWANITGRCIQPIPEASQELTPPSAPLCDDCAVRTAYSNGRLSAWLLHEQRDNALVKIDSGGSAQEIARPRFHTGPGYVNHVAWASDVGSAIVGEFSGRLEAGDQKLRTAGGMDGFVVAYDADGRVRFARSFGGAAAEQATSAAFLPDRRLRVLLLVHSDVDPGWSKRLLGGRTATADAIEVVDLSASGDVVESRRYAIGSPASEQRAVPRLIGADPDVATAIISRSQLGPLSPGGADSAHELFAIGLEPPGN